MKYTYRKHSTNQVYAFSSSNQEDCRIPHHHNINTVVEKENEEKRWDEKQKHSRHKSLHNYQKNNDWLLPTMYTHYNLTLQ